MAEINTGTSSSGGFIFGQNMEERVVKPQDEEDKTEENGASGNSEVQDDKKQNNPLKASAFRPSSGFSNSTTMYQKARGLIAPSKLGQNPFVGKPQNAGANEAGVLTSGRLAHNPFAEKTHPQPLSTPSSDSEDEKREKPIVAPTHFSAGKLATPKIVFTPDQSSESSTRAILRPSILDKQTANFGTPTPSEKNNAYKSSFKLEPARLSSPLAKDTTAGETESEKKEVAASETEEGKNRLFGSFTSAASKENDATTAAKESHKESSENGAKSGLFLFGQNMEQRVTNSASSGSQENSSNLFGVFGENNSQRVAGVVDSPPKNQTADTTKSPDAASPTQTLEESAAAHQAKQSKPELQEVEVKTGEENESNVFQITTKLYAFDKDAQSWLEKGRGILRLNDLTSEDGGRTFQSRLVMRTQGSLRVVLNTKIWAGMMVERASQKSIRISAMDEDGVKVFLVMANPKESDQIFKAIDWRVQQLKMREPKVESSLEGGEPADSHTSAIKPPEKGNKSPNHGEKRRAEPNADTPVKKARLESDQRRDTAEESNDSSTPDPETEASNESFSSTNKSSSSE